jgi:tetratricopeptide (TPR) repeat protein
VFAPSTALAQSDDARAKQLFINGSDLYKEGRYEEALIAWEEAYRLSDRPRILLNMANAYERMGELNRAMDELYRFKIYAEADEREQVERRIRMLEEKIREAAVQPDPAPNIDPVPNPVPEPRPKPARSGGGVRVAPIVLMGVGVAAIGAGAGFGLASRSAGNAAKESCTEVPDGLYCSTDAQDAIQRNRTNALIADISFAVGAVATATGVVVLATGGKKGGTQVSVSPNAIRWSGRF